MLEIGAIGVHRSHRSYRTNSPCRDARSVRPLCQRLRCQFFLTGTDALPLDTSRASLHVLLEEVFEIVPAIKVGCFAE